MSAEPGQFLLCAGDELQRAWEPAGTWPHRVMSCGCGQQDEARRLWGML